MAAATTTEAARTAIQPTEATFWIRKAKAYVQVVTLTKMQLKVTKLLIPG